MKKKSVNAHKKLLEKSRRVSAEITYTNYVFSGDINVLNFRSNKEFIKIMTAYIKRWGYKRPRNYNQVCRRLRKIRRELIESKNDRATLSLRIKFDLQ